MGINTHAFGIFRSFHRTAGGIQRTAAGNKDLFIVDINAIAGDISISGFVIRSSDMALPDQFYRQIGFAIDGSGCAVLKFVRALRDRRVIQGKRAAVPRDVVIVCRSARSHHRACIIRQSVDGGVRTACERYAADIDCVAVRCECRDGQQRQHQA